MAAQFLRYLIVGGVAFLVDFSVLMSCAELGGLHYLSAAAIGFSCGVLTNYLLSIAWVFESRRIKDAKIELLIFASIGVLGLGLNELLMWTLVAAAGIAYPLAKVASAAAILVWNFSARKLVLFS